MRDIAASAFYGVHIFRDDEAGSRSSTTRPAPMAR
jgi:hypothetical protein